MSASAQPPNVFPPEVLDELARIRETVDARTSERMLQEFADWWNATNGAALAAQRAIR